MLQSQEGDVVPHLDEAAASLMTPLGGATVTLHAEWAGGCCCHGQSTAASKAGCWQLMLLVWLLTAYAAGMAAGS
jgi:hypothetical protein